MKISRTSVLLSIPLILGVAAIGPNFAINNGTFIASARATLAAIIRSPSEGSVNVSPVDRHLPAPAPDKGAKTATEIAPQSIEVISIKTQAGQQIDFDAGRLTNNTWGAPKEEKLVSGVYVNEDRSFGWYWNRDAPQINGLEVKPIYPNIRKGGCPWQDSYTRYFPIKFGDIESLILDVAYDYPQAPAGEYNLAYDIFLTDTDQASVNAKPKAEVMIWLHSTFPHPPETYRGDYSDGINTYELYSFIMSGGRLYYSFRLKEQSGLKTQLKVDARRLMDNLILEPNWFVHGVELGNEVVKGSGRIKIGNFNVRLNGSEL